MCTTRDLTYHAVLDRGEHIGQEGNPKFSECDGYFPELVGVRGRKLPCNHLLIFPQDIDGEDLDL